MFFERVTLCVDGIVRVFARTDHTSGRASLSRRRRECTSFGKCHGVHLGEPARSKRVGLSLARFSLVRYMLYPGGTFVEETRFGHTGQVPELHALAPGDLCQRGAATTSE